MIMVTIDCLTPCLKDARTGEIYETEVVELKRKSFLSKFNKRTGWRINWSKFPPEVYIYALVLKGTMDIQGLVAVSDDKENDSAYLQWACASPENDFYFTGNRKFWGVGGHLFAIASEKSIEWGHGGFLHGEAVDVKLLQHFCKSHGATAVPMTGNQFHFIMDERASAKIREEYTYEWTDDSY